MMGAKSKASPPQGKSRHLSNCIWYQCPEFLLFLGDISPHTPGLRKRLYMAITSQARKDPGWKDVLKAAERDWCAARLPQACVHHLSGGGSPASPTWLFSTKRIFFSLTDTLGSLRQDGWALGSRWDWGASTLLRQMPPEGWATQGTQRGRALQGLQGECGLAQDGQA